MSTCARSGMAWRLFVFLLLTTVAAAPLPGGLVGYWNFDGNVEDQSGTGNDGELIDAVYDDDVPDVIGAGQSLSFELPTDHVFIEADESLNSSIFTLSMFINDRGQVDGINRFTSRAGDSFETGVDFVFGTQAISFYSPSSGWQSTSYVTSLEEWQHVAFVADVDTMTLYVDGEPIDDPFPFSAVPSGFMHIGNRHNDIEGFYGLIDDVALWDVPLPEESIAELASGTRTPLTIVPPDPPVVPEPILTIGSSVADWRESTVSIDGGPLGEWDPSGDPSPPDVTTFTLEPIPTAADLIPHINAAAGVLDVEGIVASPDVHYYRTTFDLTSTDFLSADLRLAIDNGAQVYINGELVATETSFLTENWALPLPSLSISETGEVTAVKFEEWAESFDGWNTGENEILLAVRNPFEELDPAGGFAFRLDFYSTAPAVRGDFNGNGEIDLEDIDLLTVASASGTNPEEYDLTGDGFVDQADVTEWAKAKDIGYTWIGDANFDGQFNTGDFVQVLGIGKYELPGATAVWSEGDWNGDGVFGTGDLVAALSDGGYEIGPRTDVSAVPEPLTLTQFSLGLLGLFALRQRAKRILCV